MDLAASEAPVNPDSNDVASMAEENGDGGEPVVPPPKKFRFGEEINRVAEIVLVLSAMGRMRGARSPTEVELELMSEARSKVAEMCQEFSPGDIVGRDAIGAVIEDLGLNGKLKDQRLGFRAPRLTISEKVSLGKRKMEEAKKYPPMSTGTGYTPHMSQQTGGAASPNLSNLGSVTHTVRVIDRTNPQSLSSGVAAGSSPYIAVGSNVSMAHQWPSNEFKMSTTSAPTVGSHYIRDTSGLAHSRVERPQIKSEMQTGASQGPATSANYWNVSTWSAQPQPAFTVTTVADNKVHTQSSVRTDQSFRPFMSQTPPGTFPGTNQPMQAMNYSQSAPYGNSHVEIAKIIHKVLHPRAQQNPSWNPPSREYMNKAMACQICQATINDIESVLICDACEKGYHLKCLQANNLKGVPKSEWQCSRCVQLYSGKSFPIKYGRVMRSVGMQKMPSTTAGLQLPVEKKAGTTDPKVNQPKPMVAMSPDIQISSGFASGEGKLSASISNSETTDAKANKNISSAVTASLGSHGLEGNITSSSSAAPLSHSEAVNPTTASATPNSVMKNENELLSTGHVPAVTTGIISTVPANTTSTATSDTIPSASMSVDLGLQVPTVAVTGLNSSQASGIVNEGAPTNLGTLCNAIVENSTSDSAVAASHSETAIATEDAALTGTVNASSESEGPPGNGAGCSDSLEQKHNLENQNPETTTEKESSKNGIESEEVSITCRDHSTNPLDSHHDPSVSQSTAVSEKDAKGTAESSIPQEDSSTFQTEKSVSEPLAVSSDVQEAPQEDKSVHKQPSEPEENKSATDKLSSV